MRSVAEILPTTAARAGGKVALVTASRSLTYAELDELSDAAAAALTAAGVRAGERVSLYGQNSWEWVVAYHGAVKLGAVVNPINVMLTAEEVSHVLDDCEASAIFVDSEALARLEDTIAAAASVRTVICLGREQLGRPALADVIAEHRGSPFARHPTRPRDPSTIGYTSGTTGRPKGAVQCHEAVITNCLATAEMHHRTADDIVVTALPAPHVYGNVVINSTFLSGGTVVLMERFDAGEALRLIEAHRATMFEGVPAMYAMLLADPAIEHADLSSLTQCTVGGQTIPVATIEAWERISASPLIELWGMTELSGLGTTHWAERPPLHGSIGQALPGVVVRVASLTDVTQTAAPHEPGELMVRGPIVMLGYHNDDAATRETIEPDGWLHTGDIAFADDSGYFFVVDRRKDMIITAGYNIYPAEIERVLVGHPAVALVAVGPVPDTVKGELARAYVVPATGHQPDPDELIDYCRSRLAAYKVPRSVQLVEALPQTSTGKIMRRALADLPAPA